MTEQVENSGEDRSKAESLTDRLEAAAQTGRDLIDHPEVVGVDKGSDAYQSWESEDGERSRTEFERVGEQAFIRVVRQSDVDETRLVPAPVETITLHAQLGRQGRAIAGGHIIVSGGKMNLAQYTDFLDRSNDLSDTGEALEMAQLVVDDAIEQLKSEV